MVYVLRTFPVKKDTKDEPSSSRSECVVHAASVGRVVREGHGEMRGCCQRGSLHLLFCECCEPPESLRRFIEIGFLAVVLCERVGPPSQAQFWAPRRPLPWGFRAWLIRRQAAEASISVLAGNSMDPGGRRSTVSSWNGSSPPSLQCPREEAAP